MLKSALIVGIVFIASCSTSMEERAGLPATLKPQLATLVVPPGVKCFCGKTMTSYGCFPNTKEGRIECSQTCPDLRADGKTTYPSGDLTTWPCDKVPAYTLDPPQK